MIPREKSKSKCEVRNQEKILPGRKISQFSRDGECQCQAMFYSIEKVGCLKPFSVHLMAEASFRIMEHMICEQYVLKFLPKNKYETFVKNCLKKNNLRCSSYAHFGYIQRAWNSNISGIFTFHCH